MLFLGTAGPSSIGVQARRSNGASIPKPKDYLVRGLEKIEPAFESFQGQMYAGLVSTQLYDEDNDDDDGGALMFWMFLPDEPAHDDSLTVRTQIIESI